MMKTVIRLKGDAVMVFDDRGEQMTAYQGQYDQVREKVLEDASLGAVFVNWFGNNAIPQIISREEW